MLPTDEVVHTLHGHRQVLVREKFSVGFQQPTGGIEYRDRKDTEKIYRPLFRFTTTQSGRVVSLPYTVVIHRVKFSVARPPVKP